MAQQAGQLTRKERKQLHNFRSEMAKRGITSREQFNAHVKNVPPREADRLTGLAQLAFPRSS